MSAQLDAIVDAITQVITDSPATAAVHLAEIRAPHHKKIDLRLIKVNHFLGNAGKWETCAFSFPESESSMEWPTN